MKIGLGLIIARFLKEREGWKAKISQSTSVSSVVKSLSSQKPPPSRHHRPNRLHHSKRPSSLPKAVCRPQQAREGECQDEPQAAALQRIGDQHACNGKETE